MQESSLIERTCERGPNMVPKPSLAGSEARFFKISLLIISGPFPAEIRLDICWLPCCACALCLCVCFFEGGAGAWLPGIDFIPGMFSARSRWAVPDCVRPPSSATILSLLLTGLGQPDPQSLTFIDQPSQPDPQRLTFVEMPWASPSPNIGYCKPSFLLANPSLLSARHLTSISQIRPHHAGPCRTVSGPVGTVPCQSGPCRRVGLTLEHLSFGFAMVPVFTHRFSTFVASDATTPFTPNGWAKSAW